MTVALPYSSHQPNDAMAAAISRLSIVFEFLSDGRPLPGAISSDLAVVIFDAIEELKPVADLLDAVVDDNLCNRFKRCRVDRIVRG